MSRKGCGLWLWYSLDFSLTFFFTIPVTVCLCMLVLVQFLFRSPFILKCRKLLLLHLPTSGSVTPCQVWSASRVIDSVKVPTLSFSFRRLMLDVMALFEPFSVQLMVIFRSGWQCLRWLPSLFHHSHFIWFKCCCFFSVMFHLLAFCATFVAACCGAFLCFVLFVFLVCCLLLC